MEKLTIEYWNEHVVDAGATVKGQVRIIKRQIGLLVDFFGLKRKRDLISFSIQGRKFAESTIISQYKGLLRRIAPGKLVVGKPMTIIGADLHAQISENEQARQSLNSSQFLMEQGSARP